MNENRDSGTVEVPVIQRPNEEKPVDFVDTVVLMFPEGSRALRQVEDASPDARFIDQNHYGAIVPFLTNIAERLEENLVRVWRETEQGADSRAYNHLVDLAQLAMGTYVTGIFAKHLSAKGSRSLLRLYKTPQAIAETMRLTSEGCLRRDLNRAYVRAYELLHDERLTGDARHVIDSELLLPFENGKGKGTYRGELSDQFREGKEFDESELERAVDVGSARPRDASHESFDRLTYVARNVSSLLAGEKNVRLGYTIPMGDKIYSGFPIPTPSGANIDRRVLSPEGYGMVLVEDKYIGAQFKEALFAGILKTASLAEQLDRLRH